MNYYNEIKTKLIENENYARIKDYSKERYKVQTYYEIGKILSEAGTKYGEAAIKEYAKQLSVDLNKKYTTSLLKYMRRFYEYAKSQPVVDQLSWSHYTILLSITDNNKIKYYINQSIKLNLSKRELKEKIDAKEYERLDDKTKLKLSKQEQPTIQESIKNPIIISNSKNKSIILLSSITSSFLYSFKRKNIKNITLFLKIFQKYFFANRFLLTFFNKKL